MAVDFFAGCLGGWAGVIVGHPFDTVKIRLQTQVKVKYTGTVDCFAQIIKQETTFGLFKGMTSPLLGLGFINAIIFGVHGNLTKRLDPTWGNQVLSGALSGGAQSIVCSPMELAKTRLQVQGQGETYKHIFFEEKNRYKGSVDCLYKIVKNEGLRGCFRGMSLTLLRDIPAFAAYFGSYDGLCRLLSQSGTPYMDLHTGHLFLAGGLSGMASWIVTYGVDVVKSRYQADGVGLKPVYKNPLDCARKTYQKEGIQAFYRGLDTALIRAFPTNAATLGTVTVTLRFFMKRESEVELEFY